MKILPVSSQLTPEEASACNVEYVQAQDKVLLKIGSLSIILDENSFMQMHEMMRKAAARLVVQTNLTHQTL